MILHHDTIPNAAPGRPGAIPQEVFENRMHSTCYNAINPPAGNLAEAGLRLNLRLGDKTIANGSVKAVTISSITVTGSLSASDGSLGGVTLANGDRVLVWRQAAAGQSGVSTRNSSNGLLTLVESGSAAGVYGSQYLVTSGTFANQRFWINTSNATTTGFVPDDTANPDVSLLVSAPVTIAGGTLSPGSGPGQISRASVVL